MIAFRAQRRELHALPDLRGRPVLGSGVSDGFVVFVHEAIWRFSPRAEQFGGPHHHRAMVRASKQA